ncbi:RHS repeat domain-containing protein [Pleionea mediterranea]|uniref:RHS repeat-associated protein n=1 Tax=Pleionea mediterranea TaxID=523701 RepID=A0A316FW30_9GAMM|nr:RHS repeat-associated core domain-containing protein [Pleionea mediterranea]PWK51810.1 RHS repeat-associated protein [Pleionea mediterranea]
MKLSKLLQLLFIIIIVTTHLNSLSEKVTITFIHTDHLGSPIMATDEEGQVKWREEYQPFGKQLTNADNNNNVGFTGHKDDKSLGLSYMQARWYHPEAGRFMSLDPIRYRDVHSYNRYVYGNNNPYKYVDPDGREVRNPNKHRVHPATVIKLDRLDKNTPGVDYIITSGQRTAEHNKKIGGAKSSHHVTSNGGTGVDANPSVTSAAPIGTDTDSIAEEASKAGFTGIITYTKEDGTSNNADANGGRLHLDSRKVKFHARQKKNSKREKYYEKRNYGK